MKFRLIILTLAAGCVLASCHTSRQASRRRQVQADYLSGPLGAQGGVAPLERLQPADEGRGADVAAAEPAEVLPPLQCALRDIMADTLLQTSMLGLSIVDVATGEVICCHNARQRMRPASTEKMVTAIAALGVLGPNHQLRTRLMTTADVVGGTLRGDLYVRGAMDPLLTAADVRTLAQRLHNAGIREVRGRLVADATLKDADKWGWGWCWDDDNPELSPMLVGGKPALATALLNALRGAGVKVSVPTVVRGQTPAAARELASVGHALREVLQPMLKESDNLCAEAVFYQLGPTRKAVEQRIRAALPVSADAVIADGSGLSLYNYQTAETFTNLLLHAVAQPDSILTPLLAALPIAATDGTLKRRMADTPAAGNVRAKTGSVTAVSTLVGFTRQRSTGHLIAFAILNQGVRTMAEGRNLQDRICIALSE